MQTLKPLRTTDGINKGKRGLGKAWLAKDEAHRELLLDCVLKANFSVQDFNKTIECGFAAQPKDVIYLIVLADWICDSYRRIKDCLRDDVARGFWFSDTERLDLYGKFLKALRSAVVAHPLTTDRHSDYGFGGNRICVDIRGKSRLDDYPQAKLFRLFVGKFEKTDCVRDDDVVLATYSTESAAEKDGLHFQRVCFDMADIRETAELYIDALYELDHYVAGLKKRDFQ